MSSAVSDAFEIGLAGRESEFGKTWLSFLAALTVPQIYGAERDLVARLQIDRLERKKFLDIGSGGGLMSLAARRRGARVFSFDSDPQAVACALELRRRYLPGDQNWQIEQGSVLDRTFLKSLDTFDLVFADNVLNHTGAMMEALENLKPLVAVGGQLHLSIYNDYQEVSDRWDRLKQTYHSLPRPVAFLFGLGLIARSEANLFLAHRRLGTTRHWLKSWLQEQDVNGTSRWHDWMQWLQAYPYERASVEDVVELYGRDGFRLISASSPRSIMECASFVFYRDHPVGLPADQFSAHTRSRAPRQLSVDAVFRPVIAPWTETDAGWTGIIDHASDLRTDCHFALFRDGKLVGPASIEGERVVVAPTDEAQSAVSQADFYVVAGEARPLRPPFRHERGRMWSTAAPDLARISDDVAQSYRSPVLLFENGHQLRKPHSAHEEIAHRGGGNFSHWESTIYFSSSDGSDPNFSGNSYAIMIGGYHPRTTPATSKSDEDESGALVVTPEMISAGVEVIEEWERSGRTAPDALAHPGPARIKLVTAVYTAMRAQN